MNSDGAVKARSRQRPARWRVGALLIAVLSLSTLAACAASRQAPPATLTVAAASDLQPAFAEIGRRFEQETGTKVTFVYGSSGTLATQIENGAPVDLFASASEVYTQQLAAKGVIVPGSEQVYAIGRLALVSAKSSGVQIARLEDLLQPTVKHVALANPEHAPYGAAARQALVAAGLWEQVRPKAVYGENVRQALQFVQTGNAEAGLVARSLADLPEVAVAPIPASLYPPLRQTLAIIKGTDRPEAARRFAAFVAGPPGRAVLERYHFDLPGGGEQ